LIYIKRLKRNLPPVHLGEVLKEEFIVENGLAVNEATKGLEIARADMAVKLGEAFGNTSLDELTKKL
jgi:plasmid maintenance system antidote protein VapI